MKVEPKAVLICTSLTTLVLYIFQVSFGVSALEQQYEVPVSYVYVFQGTEKSQAVAKKMIETFIFLFFSVFMIVGLIFKVEILWANILGYTVLLGSQAYGTFASFDTTIRSDFGEVPNYCVLLDNSEYYSLIFVSVEDRNVGHCKMALAAGFFIIALHISSLFLTARILQNSVRASVAQMVPVLKEASEIPEAEQV